MLIVFQSSSKGQLAQSLGIATWYNDYPEEDFQYCIEREKAQEILSCRALGIPYVVLSKGFFDGELIDTNVEIKSLPKDTALVLRCSSSVKLPGMLAHLRRWITDAEMARVGNWPDHICQPDVYLKRFVTSMSRDLFSEIIRSGNLAFPLFIKTLEKSNFHQIVSSARELAQHFISVENVMARYPHKGAAVEGLALDTLVRVDKKEDWYCPYRDQTIQGRVEIDTLEEGIILSDVMDLKRTSNHKGEYRGYFINGELSSISAYMDYESNEVPQRLRSFANEFGRAHGHLAKAFVADFGMTDQGPVLIELNEFGYSGRYVDNDPIALFQDLAVLFDLRGIHLIAPQVPTPGLAQTTHPAVKPAESTIDFGMPSQLIFSSDDEIDLKKAAPWIEPDSVDTTSETKRSRANDSSALVVGE